MSQITPSSTAVPTAPNAPPALVPPPERPTSPAPIEDGRFAPRPTHRTMAMRTFIPWQILRFAVINLRMFRIIARSHD